MYTNFGQNLVREAGVEPARSVWKTDVLPLNTTPANVEASGGIEPPTYALTGHRSTPELRSQSLRGERRALDPPFLVADLGLGPSSLGL